MTVFTCPKWRKYFVSNYDIFSAMLPLFVAMLALFDKLGHALNGENILFQITIFFSAMLPLFVAMLPVFVVSEFLYLIHSLYCLAGHLVGGHSKSGGAHGFKNLNDYFFLENKLYFQNKNCASNKSGRALGGQ